MGPVECANVERDSKIALKMTAGDRDHGFEFKVRSADVQMKMPSFTFHLPLSTVSYLFHPVRCLKWQDQKTQGRRPSAIGPKISSFFFEISEVARAFSAACSGFEGEDSARMCFFMRFFQW